MVAKVLLGVFVACLYHTIHKAMDVITDVSFVYISGFFQPSSSYLFSTSNINQNFANN